MFWKLKLHGLWEGGAILTFGLLFAMNFYLKYYHGFFVFRAINYMTDDHVSKGLFIGALTKSSGSSFCSFYNKPWIFLLSKLLPVVTTIMKIVGKYHQYRHSHQVACCVVLIQTFQLPQLNHSLPRSFLVYLYSMFLHITPHLVNYVWWMCHFEMA